jgi:broad specificity phosphatase PhoE
MDVVLVRHGETQWNVDGRFRGRAEVPLSVIALHLPTDALWRIEQHPCAISVLRYHAQRWTVVTMNDTCHLAAIQ